MDSVHSTSISLPLRLQAASSESPLSTGVPVLPVSRDGKSCGLLHHWSCGRTDPPAAEGTPSRCPRGIHSFSPASPSKGEEPSSRLPKPPCSSRTTWFPRSRGDPGDPGCSPEGCDLGPCPQSPRSPTGICCGGSCPLPPRRAFPLRTYLLPLTGLVSAEPSLGWGSGGGGAATGEGEGGRCLGPQGAFISPQPQTYTPKAVFHLLLEALPPRDECPPSCIFRSTLPVGGVCSHGRAGWKGGEWHPVL